MGGMKFDSEKQRGTKCKELGPITCCSVAKIFFHPQAAKGTSISWRIPRVVSFLTTSMDQIGLWVNIFTPMDSSHLKPSYIVFK